MASWRRGSFKLYEDDAQSFDYQKGAYRVREISVTPDGKHSVETKGKGPALYGKIIAVEKMK